MSERKIVAASIVNFLKQQLDSDNLSVDSRESMEVGVQCIETAFELTPEELSRGVDLLQLIRQQRGGPPRADLAEAEKLKNEGNELMKSEHFREALEKYTRAIELNPQNSVFYCNRAAAHFKLGEHETAIADCMAALALQPNYGKAHGRLGIALTALERHDEARTAFARAVQLEPDNESYKQNLKLAEERVGQRGGDNRQFDLGSLLQNTALVNMATEMVTAPNMQNFISGLMNSTATTNQANGAQVMDVLLEAGQALAQHLQSSSPELVEQLRRTMRPPGPGDNQPPPPPPPAPPAPPAAPL